MRPRQESEVGRYAAQQAVLRWDDEATVVADYFLCYSQGVQFRLWHARWLDAGPPTGLWDTPLGPADFEQAQLTVTLSDGRAATSVGWRTSHDSLRFVGEGPALSMLSSGGGVQVGRRYVIWLWPLPPPGPLHIDFQWPTQGFPPCQGTVDATVLRRCARESIALAPTRATDERTGPRSAPPARARGSAPQPLRGPNPDPLGTPPHGVLGAVVDIRAVLVRDSRGAVVVDGFVCYPDSVMFQLTVVRNDAPYGLLTGEVWRLRGGSAPEHDLRFTVLFSDGRSATSIVFGSSRRSDRGGPESEPVLRPCGSLQMTFTEGEVRRRNQPYRLSPLPPRGTLTFAIAWPSVGLAEHRAVVNSDVLGRAAHKARRFWTDPPPEDDHINT